MSHRFVHNIARNDYRTNLRSICIYQKLIGLEQVIIGVSQGKSVLDFCCVTTIFLFLRSTGVQITNTYIADISWSPSPFIENSVSEDNTLIFNIDLVAQTNINAAGIDGSDLWQVSVYLSGDDNCLIWDESTQVVVNSLSNVELDQDLVAGQQLTFDLNNVEIPVNNILCMNARYVCARLSEGDNPSNDFTLTGVRDESSLIGSYETDCRG